MGLDKLFEAVDESDFEMGELVLRVGGEVKPVFFSKDFIKLRLLLSFRPMLIHFFEVMCEENEPECENLLPQLSQPNGFSPECMRTCSFK